MKRGFTLVELIVVVVIILVVILAVVGLTHRDRAMATVPLGESGPEATNAYEVHIVSLGVHFTGTESSHIRDALTNWLALHKDRRIISVIRASGGSGSDLVIVAFRGSPGAPLDPGGLDPVRPR